MVEPVSYSAGKARLQRAGSDTSVSSTAGGPAKAQMASGAGPKGSLESVALSIGAGALPAELRAGPPVDAQSVSRIREAIAENRYPIDINAITESLFQSFLEVSR